MTDSANTPLLQTLRWLATHAGFPASRLPGKAELLLLITTAAADDECENLRRQKARPGPDRDYNAKIRNYTIKRRHAHVKCDNSAKT